MSDLISREALLKTLDEIRKCGLQNSNNYKTAKQLLDETYSQLLKAPTAIAQGEVVIDKAAYDGAREDLSIWKRRALEAEEKVRKYDQRIVDIGVIAMTPVTTQQQHLSVADALEEALTIALEYTQYSHERRQITNRIRALIKRNAEGVESDDLKDAKRYRWLREVSRDPDAGKPHCVITKEVLEKGNPARMVSYLKFDEALDAEIDRAIAVKEGE